VVATSTGGVGLRCLLSGVASLGVVTSVKLVEIRNVGEVPIGAVAPMELRACLATDGIFDDAATAIATVKPLYEGRHVKQELDSTRAFL